MDRTERFYRIDQLLNERGVVSFQALQEALEVSRATLHRDLDYLRNRLNAPIIFDRERGGYRFDTQTPHIGQAYELPGLWFNPSEVHALLTMQHLLANVDPGGILTPHIAPLMARLNALLDASDSSAEEIRQRICIIAQGRRRLRLEHFEQVGSALLRRQRLCIRYFARGTGDTSVRIVSPQRLVHYRENWYLDAWCHLRNELRNFAVDAIQRVDMLEQPALEVPRHTMDDELGPGYGIFSDDGVQWARLRFCAARARWVAEEHWHARQRGTLDASGRYTLELPYSDDRELLMDILKYGADVEVLDPPELRQRVLEELRRTLQGYGQATP